MPTRTRSRSRDEEPEEETPRRGRGRRSREDEPEDEAPRRSRRSRDDEPEEEETPRRGRRRDSADEEDEKPSRRGRRSRDEEPEDEAPRRGRGRRRDSDDEDEKPARRRGKATAGFDSFKSKKVSNGDFAEEFQPHKKVNEEHLFKFVDDGPFDSYNQHWIEELKGSRQSFVCYDPEYLGEDDDEECPLCALGDKPRTYALFNVIDLANPRKPKVKVWKAPTTVAEIIERLADSSKTSPINDPDLYFTVEALKANRRINYQVKPVKARDLEEDFDMDALSDDELDALEADRHDDRSAVTKVDTFDDLAEVADDL